MLLPKSQFSLETFFCHPNDAVSYVEKLSSLADNKNHAVTPINEMSRIYRLRKSRRLVLQDKQLINIGNVLVDILFFQFCRV